MTLKDKCHLTFEPLLNEAFLIYHCGHQVHTKAAILEEISICRDPARKVKLEDVKQERDLRTISLVGVLVWANFECSASRTTGTIDRTRTTNFGIFLDEDADVLRRRSSVTSVRGTLKSQSKKWINSNQGSKEMKKLEPI